VNSRAPREDGDWQPRVPWQRVVVDRFLDPMVDRALGIDTGGFESVQSLGLDPNEAFDYRVAGWRSLQAIIHRSEVTPADVFVDLGCGKGRVLFLATRYRFKRIIGVDLSPAMVETARRNLSRTSRVQVEMANAAEWFVPDDVTFAFLYNPFPNPIFERVIENLLESLRRRPRTLRVIYRRPYRMHSFLLEQGFTHIRKTASGPTNLYAAPALR
jgi:SAM-dependent methyltransferase